MRSKYGWVVLVSLALLSCSKANFQQQGFYTFSSKDNVLVTTDQLPESVTDYPRSLILKNVTCPTFIFASDDSIQSRLFNNAIILSNTNRGDVNQLKRIASTLGVTHLLDCELQGNSKFNNRVLLAPNSTLDTRRNAQSFWSAVQFNLYDLTSGRLLESLTVKITSSHTSFENKSNMEVARVQSKTTPTMLKKGIKKGIKKLTDNCQ